MKIALYARISTTDPNCEMQLRELREYCQCRGWSIYQEYVDIRWSGSKAIRPQRSKLMADAVVHRFDAVLVWTLQRWGRSVADCAESLQQLHNWGIRWMAVAQKLEMDKATSTSHLIVHVLRSWPTAPFGSRPHWSGWWHAAAVQRLFLYSPVPRAPP